MSFRLFDTKPFCKPLLGYCQLVSEVFNQNINFSLKKGMKISSAKWRPFCPVGDELMNSSCFIWSWDVYWGELVWHNVISWLTLMRTTLFSDFTKDNQLIESVKTAFIYNECTEILCRKWCIIRDMKIRLTKLKYYIVRHKMWNNQKQKKCFHICQNYKCHNRSDHVEMKYKFKEQN